VIKLAQERVQASRLPIPVIDHREAILEAELLYRAALRYDLPTLLEEGRARLNSFPVQEIDKKYLRSLSFWKEYSERLQHGEVVGLSENPFNALERFKFDAWGMVVTDGETKMVVRLSTNPPRKEETLAISIPRDFAHLYQTPSTSIYAYNLRKTGKFLDPERAKQIGLAQALVEKEAGAELIL
jgi:hypothetical protein